MLRLKSMLRKAGAVTLACLLVPGQVSATDNLVGKWLPQQWGIYEAGSRSLTRDPESQRNRISFCASVRTTTASDSCWR